MEIGRVFQPVRNEIVCDSALPNHEEVIPFFFFSAVISGAGMESRSLWAVSPLIWYLGRNGSNVEKLWKELGRTWVVARVDVDWGFGWTSPFSPISASPSESQIPRSWPKSLYFHLHQLNLNNVLSPMSKNQFLCPLIHTDNQLWFTPLLLSAALLRTRPQSIQTSGEHTVLLNYVFSYTDWQETSQTVSLPQVLLFLTKWAKG